MHPAIPSPYAGANEPKVIYVSSKTPFISVVKRVRKLLSLADKRSMGKVDLQNRNSSDKQRLRAMARQEKEPEEILLKATNRAIEKVLGLALFFQGQEDCRVKLRTGSVGVIDDIVEIEAPDETVEAGEVAGKGAVESHQSSVDQVGTADQAQDEDNDDIPETQIRTASVVEVGISLR